MSADQNTGGVPPKTVRHDTEVGQALEQTKEDRVALKGLLDPLSRQLWTDVICMLEEIFPHKRDDQNCPKDDVERRANERLFAAYRHRVLRVGNTTVREQHKFIDTFAMRQLLIREVTVTRVEPRGPWGLPAGVLMPGERK
jgi:hypothetical protein